MAPLAMLVGIGRTVVVGFGRGASTSAGAASDVFSAADVFSTAAVFSTATEAFSVDDVFAAMIVDDIWEGVLAADSEIDTVPSPPSLPPPPQAARVKLSNTEG